MLQKIVVGVTGASGSIYAKCLLEEIQKHTDQVKEVAVVFSEEGKQVWEYELGQSISSIPFKIYENTDFFASFASGSSNFHSMIVCPCSMGTLARIANGLADNLISRSADVMLKERRKLVLVVRETPFNLIHIQNMEKVTLAGGIIFPASPSFYHKPESIEEMARSLAQRVLSQVGINTDLKSWGS